MPRCGTLQHVHSHLANGGWGYTLFKMLEILNIPDIRERVAPISIDRYHRMIESGMFADWNVELLSGVLVEKMSKTDLHILIVDILLEKLGDFCSRSEYWVRQELPLTIGNSEPEPDISVVKGDRTKLRKQKPATAQFIAEVAVSSLAIDRAKASDYATAGVPEYWIVRPKEGKTELYRNPVNGVYTEELEIPADNPIESSALPGFLFKLSDHI